MQAFLEGLFAPSAMTPHGFCLLWDPWLVWAHVGANLAIGLAYFSIPVALITFIRRRRDIGFRPVFWLFAAFILLCGAGHFADLLTLWVPAYGLEAAIKIATAVVSVATAVALWPMIPTALRVPSPRQLQQALDELAAREAEQRARFLRAPVPMHALDAKGHVTGVTHRWLDLLGYEDEQEVTGRHITEFMDADSAAEVRAYWPEQLTEGEQRDSPRRYLRRDGTAVDCLVSGRVERTREGEAWVIGVLVDVTGRRQAEAALRASEERLRQTQKMEALGQLAGGIAHDFNNVLQAIVGGVALIQKRAHDPAAVARLGVLVGDAAQRGTATTRRLLGFARRSALHAGPVPPAALLLEVRDMLAHALGAGITVQVASDAGLPPLLADRAELETVLINLATNARDAMPSGGTLTFHAAAETVTGPDHPAGLSPGRFVRIDVTDTGIGMDAGTLARAAEPFFTTKPVDQGTGLGLAMARGFAAQSGGGLGIRSRPGQGTTVSLWLPELAGDVAATPADPVRSRPDPAAARRGVLLVDDEPLVREVLAAGLEEAGFRVVPVGSAAAALEVLGGGAPVDVLVTDLSMPGQDGLSLIREAQALRPGLRAILVTGYAGDASALAVDGATRGAFSLLRKPVSPADLADRAARLLEEARA